jgi:3-phosphoshikimate 1-carboxyvinyltransferase
MQLEARPAGPLSGSARPPGDKSISHRALILGALAKGETEIHALLEGDDVLRTAAAVRNFGADVRTEGSVWRVKGRGGFATPSDRIDCGNSGTGVRLLMGAAAGFPLTVAFDGDASLRGRPMRRVLAPLIEMNVRVLEGDGDHLPLTLSCGYLRSIAYRLPVASAQVKSAVLLAGLNAKGVTEVIEPEPTRDHTERMLRAFGAEIGTGESGAARVIRLQGGQRLRPTTVRVPGDPSSAAFPIVAALIVPGSEIRIENVLLNPLRTGLYETLRKMGADLSVENERDEGGERVGDIVARHSQLRGVVVPPERAPSMIDEYPILAVAAAFAHGETIMRGIGELRVKESDRIALMAQGLAACGAEVQEKRDGLVVRGSDAAPRGGALVRTNGDHRIAMAHLVLGLAAAEPIAVDDADMIDTSFPDFAGFMRALGAAID